MTVQIRRGPLVVLGAACLAVAFLIGFKLRDNPHPTSQDLWGWHAVSSNRLWSTLDVLLFGHARSIVSDFAPVASPGTAIALAVALFLVFRWLGRPRTALFCLGAPVLSLVVTEWIGKPLFHRTLGTALAYPSGHTTAAVSAGTLLVLLAWRSGGLRRAALAFALWTVPCVSMLLYLLVHRVHYPSDIVGGIAIGTAMPCLLAAVIFGRPRVKPSPVEGPPPNQPGSDGLGPEELGTSDTAQQAPDTRQPVTAAT